MSSLDILLPNMSCPFPLRCPVWPSPYPIFPRTFIRLSEHLSLRKLYLELCYILSWDLEQLQSSVSTGHFSNPFQIPSHVIGELNSQLWLAFVLKLECKFCPGSRSSFLMLSPLWPAHFSETIVLHKLTHWSGALESDTPSLNSKVWYLLAIWSWFLSLWSKGDEIHSEDSMLWCM